MKPYTRHPEIFGCCVVQIAGPEPGAVPEGRHLPVQPLLALPDGQLSPDCIHQGRSSQAHAVMRLAIYTSLLLSIRVLGYVHCLFAETKRAVARHSKSHNGSLCHAVLNQHYDPTRPFPI